MKGNGVIFPDVDAHGDECEYHETGLRLVAALLDRLAALEQRVEALEARERARRAVA